MLDIQEICMIEWRKKLDIKEDLTTSSETRTSLKILDELFL